MSLTVTAVVVTYNRADKLPTVLDRLAAQSRPPQRILVIDNASTDETPTVLEGYADRPGLEVIRLDTNTGGAGGFATGMRLAYEAGADFAWIMDDDCYAEPDALAELLTGLEAAEKQMGIRLPFACSVVQWIDGDVCEMNNPGTTWDWGRLLVRDLPVVLVEHCSFVSVLVPRWTMAQYGLPLSEYFIWFDDQEYTRRITAGAPGIQCLNSRVVHDLPVNRGVNFADVTAQNLWKFSYGVRNEASYQWHHVDKAAAVRFAQRVHRGLKEGRVPRRLRLELAKKFVAGLRFDPQPEYPKTVL